MADSAHSPHRSSLAGTNAVIPWNPSTGRIAEHSIGKKHERDEPDRDQGHAPRRFTRVRSGYFHHDHIGKRHALPNGAPPYDRLATGVASFTRPLDAPEQGILPHGWIMKDHSGAVHQGYANPLPLPRPYCG